MKNIVSRINAGVFRLLPGHLGERLIFRGELMTSDVFLVGHPKSGNTWLAFMLAVLVNNDREKLINISNISDFVPTIHGNDQSVRGYKKLQTPRIFRTEAPNYPDSYPRTIYIVRDPRAVLLSYYHHCVHDTCRTDWPISEFVDEMLSVGCIESLEPDLIRWDHQVDTWLKRAKHQPVSIVKYEDLKHDCQNVLRQLSDFIGLDYDAELLDIAVKRGDFSRMREDEKRYGAESYPGEKGKQGFFVRKGKIDSWKEEVPADVIQMIEQQFNPVMKKLGYLS